MKSHERFAVKKLQELWGKRKRWDEWVLLPRVEIQQHTWQFPSFKGICQCNMTNSPCWTPLTCWTRSTRWTPPRHRARFVWTPSKLREMDQVSFAMGQGKVAWHQWHGALTSATASDVTFHGWEPVVLDSPSLDATAVADRAFLLALLKKERKKREPFLWRDCKGTHSRVWRALGKWGNWSKNPWKLDRKTLFRSRLLGGMWHDTLWNASTLISSLCWSQTDPCVSEMFSRKLKRKTPPYIAMIPQNVFFWTV